MFTSSGLGDRRAARVRGGLFRGILDSATDDVEAQDAFHRHRWPGRPEISVWMSRPDACTVARVIVEVGVAGVSVREELFWSAPAPPFVDAPSGIDVTRRTGPIRLPIEPPHGDEGRKRGSGDDVMAAMD